MSGPHRPHDTSPSGRYLGRLVQEVDGSLSPGRPNQAGFVPATRNTGSAPVSLRRSSHTMTRVCCGETVSLVMVSESITQHGVVDCTARGLSWRIVCCFTNGIEGDRCRSFWSSDRRTDRLLYLLNSRRHCNFWVRSRSPTIERGFDGMDASGVGFSADGKQFAVGFSLWDLDSGKMLRGLPKVEEGGEFGFVKHRTITFVPDGSFIVGHDRQSILIWDTNTNETEYAFQVMHFTQERQTMMEESGALPSLAMGNGSSRRMTRSFICGGSGHGSWWRTW